MSDDDNWELYVPQVGGRYAEGGQYRRRYHAVWHDLDPSNLDPVGIFFPRIDIYEYRRPKQKAEEPMSEPAAQPSEYEARVTQMTVARTDTPTFDSSAVTITVEDNGAGEFVVLKHTATGDNIGIEPEYWPTIREAINAMIQNCRSQQ